MNALLIHHLTRYRYASPVTLGDHRLLLRPRAGHDIRIVSSSLVIDPLPAKFSWARDMHNNSIALAHFDPAPVNELVIRSDIVVEHYDDQPLDFFVEDRAVNFPFLLLPGERIELGPYLIPSYLNDQTAVAAWVGQFWRAGQLIETYTLVDQMNRAIARDFTYAAREEAGVQRPARTLEIRSGSCRDFATLLIEACRFLGLPARFVSGYASTEDIPAALGATHAWSEVFLRGAGWKGFDSTGGSVVGHQHIAVAVGRDPESLPPIAGAFFSELDHVESTLDVEVVVSRRT
jgi:transglutaminase-like putative cysteine protease